MKRSGLGRGLNDLLGTDAAEKNTKSTTKSTKKVPAKKTEATEESKPFGSETMVKITQIEPNPNQPRTNFSEDEIQEMADSIKQHGIIEPLVVTKKGRNYMIVSGERRWRGARLAKLKEVPVVIRDYTDQQIVEIALIENIQREDLNPIEEALAYQRLINEFNLKQDEVATRVSKSRVTITNSMRLLKLAEPVQQMLIEDKISSGHARALLGINDPEQQAEVALQVFDHKLSVRETEKLIKKLQSAEVEPKKKDIENLFLYTEAEKNLKERLGTKVSIKAKAGGKGKIEIEYYSEEDLENLVDRLNTI